ncbi:hypothetical protein ACIKTA_01425 [Hansschlegelia beijingensis]
MKMRRCAYALAACAAISASPALAQPCQDRIAALEPRLVDEGRAAISASTSGKETGARREAKAVDGKPSAAAGGETQGERAAEEAAGGGDGVLQAKAKVNEARIASQDGDENRCAALVAEAERLLEPRP